MITLQAKREKGLFLPYTLGKIALCYTMLPVVEIIVSMVLLIAFVHVPAWLIAIELIGYGFLTYLWHLMTLKFLKQRKWLDTAAGMIIVALSVLLI